MIVHVGILPALFKLLFLANVPCGGECSYRCAVINGEEQCFCPAGFELSLPEGTQCVGMVMMLRVHRLYWCYIIIARR